MLVESCKLYRSISDDDFEWIPPSRISLPEPSDLPSGRMRVHWHMEFCRLVSHVLLQMSRRRQKREVGYAREWNAEFLCHTYNEIPRVDEDGECTNAQTHNAFGVMSYRRSAD